MHLLVIGGSGLLGGELIRQALAAGEQVSATFHTGRLRPGPCPYPLDVTHREDVAQLVARLRPDAVVNTAYRQGDWSITADGAMHVAAAAAGYGCRLVHVSSDAIFSGRAPAYDERARPDPVHPYGAAKAAAEVAVAGLDVRAAIVRTSLIVGSDGTSPTERLVHDLAAGRVRGTLFTDEIRCAVHVVDLAAALLELARSPEDGGVHHVAGTDPVSRHDLGVLIARRDGLDERALPAGSRAAAGIPGPLEVRLDCARTRAILVTPIRGARTFLSAAARSDTR